MKIICGILILIGISISRSQHKDCIEFNYKLPIFNDSDSQTFKKFYPIIVESDPGAFLGTYLSSIEKTEHEYNFTFSALEKLRLHSCPEFKQIQSDGSFSVSIDLKAREIVWHTNNTKSNGRKIKIK